MSLSLLRALPTRNCTRLSARRFSTATPEKKSSSSWSLWLAASGLAGLGGYAYMKYNPSKPIKKPIQDKSPLDPQNFVDFKLKAVEHYNHNTSKFIFELPEDQASLLPITSCVVVKSSDPEALKDDKGKPVIRPYTPVSPSDAPGELTFLVKKYPQGKASKYIHELKPGDSLSIKGPIPKFPYKTNEFENVALIGGGSGITPLYQVLQHALPDKTNKTKFTLIYSNLTPADILLKEEFDDWAKKYPSTFKVVYAVDKPDEKWTGPTGHINKQLIEKYVAPASDGDKVKVFVCGPPGQVASLAGKKAGMKQGEIGGVLKDMGYNEDQVFKF